MLAIFLDIETTGLDPVRHRAIDIAFRIIDISSKKTRYQYQSIIKQPPEAWENKDPGSIEINGYTWEQVVTGKEPSLVTNEIIDLFGDLGIERGKAVFICQNPAFDRGFFTHLVDVYTQEKLLWPYHWLDLASMYWAFLVQKYAKEGAAFPEQLSLSKNEIAKAFNLPPESTPHRAMNGVNHLIQCYEAVLGVNFEF